MIMCLVFSGKVKKAMGKWQICRCISSITTLKFGDWWSNCLEKLVCALYGYKNETTILNIQVKVLQMKGVSDLALLPPCKGNLKLHISGAHYVANMYVNAIKLHMCLGYPTYHDNITDFLKTCDREDDDCFSEYEFTDDKISDTIDSERLVMQW